MPRNSCSTMRITLGKPKRLPVLVFLFLPILKASRDGRLFYCLKFVLRWEDDYDKHALQQAHYLDS